MKISAVIIAKNEADLIQRCIKSLEWSDQIIVIDDYSTDRTVKVSQKLGAKVFQRHLKNNFASQRNFGLGKAKHPWVLFVDADEQVSPQLASEIKSSVKKSPAPNGYLIRRRDTFLGKDLRFGETSQAKLLRLAKKSAGRWHRPVHETWIIKGRIDQFKNPLDHFPHQNLKAFINSINSYTDIEAIYRSSPEPPSKISLLGEALFFPLGKFILNYIIRLGFLDGIPGLIMALGMSYHSLLVRIKLYEKSLH